jgi:hypothetical protein
MGSLSSLIQSVCQQLAALAPAPFSSVLTDFCNAIVAVLSGFGL